MKEVEEIMMKVPVFAIDGKCEHCPNLVFESLGTVLKCKNAHICWNALALREGKAREE